MVQLLYYSILFILIINFIFDRLLDYLNTTQWSSDLPNELIGIYDLEKYKQSIEYEKAKNRLALISDSLGFLSILGAFAFGFFGWLDGIIRLFVSNPIHISLIFFLILWLLSEILTLPFKWVNTFGIESKFGFNKSTRRLFLFDQLKGFIVGILIGGSILYCIIWIYLIAGNLFWVLALTVIATFSLFMLLFYSRLIVPLFNKQTPLPEGELKTAITDFSQKAGFLVDNIFVMDGSKRSTKANAYFTGLGSKKRIVLFDTLISDLTSQEIVAVLAHEIGHSKKHHIYSSLLISLISTALMLYLFSFVNSNMLFAQVLGSNVPGFHLSLISFGILYMPLSILLRVITNYKSRLNEYEADHYAKEIYSGEFLSSALKKLSVNNLTNLTPHKSYVFFHYSHPTLLQRLHKIG
jgi:STE24 endopeptidase